MFPRGPEAVAKSPCADFSGVNAHIAVTVTIPSVFKVEAACPRPPLLTLASARESRNIKRPKLACYMSAARRGRVLKLAGAASVRALASETDIGAAEVGILSLNEQANRAAQGQCEPAANLEPALSA